VAAIGADKRKLVAALFAELGIVLIDGLAIRADHPAVSPISLSTVSLLKL
jgi:hypothetical protein